MKRFHYLIIVAVLPILLPSLLPAQQLFEPWISGALRSAVTLPQIDGVAAWADMHGNSDDYLVTSAEHRQDVAVAGRDAAGNLVTAIYWAKHDPGNHGVFVPPSPDPASPSYSQNLTPAIDGSSIAWCDYNNDGFPDLAVAGTTAQITGRVVLYLNRERAGAQTAPWRELVEDIPATNALNALQPGTSLLLWLDYDNDGKTDLLTSGRPQEENTVVTRMFRNTGNGIFTREDAALSSVPRNLALLSMDIADYDLDSDLDLLLSEFSGEITVLDNLGNGTFVQFSQPCRFDGFGPEAILQAKSAWVDLNDDRYPDIVMAGRTLGGNDQPAARFALNTPAALGGGRAFARPVAIADPIGLGSNLSKMVQLKVGDMNHDGKGDMVVAGYDANDAPAFRIYRPSVAPNGTVSVTADPQSAFYQPRAAGSVPVEAGGLVAGGGWTSLSLGDFQSVAGATASSLDVLLLGTSHGSPVGGLLCNEGVTNTDTAPAPNINWLKVSMKWDGAIRFLWEADANQTTAALRVRRFVTDLPGSSYYISPGSRDVPIQAQATVLPQPGNAGGAEFWDWKQHDLVPGDRIYWGVATVNARFRISSFAWHPNAGHFRVPYLTPMEGLPLEAANKIERHGGSAWADIDGDGDVDGIVGGSQGVRLWINMGNGNFELQAVPPNFGGAGRYEWGDVNGDGRLDLLVSSKPDGVDYRGGIFRNLGGENAAIQFSPFEAFAPRCMDAKFADCDGDGDLDVAALVQGGASKILINQGPILANDPLGERRWSSTAAPGPVFTREWGSVSWADIDNDGRPDLLLSGRSDGPHRTSATMYRNAGMLPNGGVDFQALVTPALPQVEAARPAWGDFDGDGYLDLFIGGQDLTADAAPERAVLLNRSDGNGGRTFLLATAEAGFDGSGVTEEGFGCEALWVDLNNDGWLDLAAFSTTARSVYLSELVNGVRTLVRAVPLSSGSYGNPAEPAAIALPGDLPAGNVRGLAALDADGDGRMDLLTGTSGGGSSGYAIYRNNFNVAPMQPPTAPATITAEFDPLNNTLDLDWGASPDADHYNLLVEDTAEVAAVVPLQSGPHPERWPLTGQAWTLSGFHPLLGRTYRIGVQSVNQNRQVSALTSAEIRFPTTLAGNVIYRPPVWPLLVRRLGSATGLRVYADLNSNGAWDGVALEPSAITDENGDYRLPIDTPGMIQLRISGLCPNGGLITVPAPVVVAANDGGREIPVGDFEVTDAYEVEVAVFYDRDRDGVRDAGEELMEDWQLTLDADRNGAIDAGEESHESGGIFSCLTDAGLLQPGGVPNLTFVLARSALAPPPQDWLVLLQGAGGPVEHAYQFPLGVPEVLALDEVRHVRVPAVAGFRVTFEVGVWSGPRTVYGHVIHDQNANGVWDLINGEVGLDDWEVLLDSDNDGIHDPDLGEMLVETSGGSFVFYPVTPGCDYQVIVLKPDNTWVQSFPLAAAMPISVGADNITGLDFGFFQPGGLGDAPANRADAMTDTDGNGAPKVMDYLFGRAVRGQPLQGLRMAGAMELFGKNPTLPIRTNMRYPVFKFRMRPSHPGITYAVRAASSLDLDPSKELAWREVSSTTTTDGMIEREIVVLPALSTLASPRLPDPLGNPPARAFMSINVDFSSLPDGSTAPP